MKKLKTKLRANYETPPTPLPVMTSSHESHSEDGLYQKQNHSPKLVMPVSPQISTGHDCCNTKKFADLSVEELVERLNICGMVNVANICQAEHLDGDYISKLSREELTKDPFHLSDFHLKKMERIKADWVPALC